MFLCLLILISTDMYFQTKLSKYPRYDFTEIDNGDTTVIYSDIVKGFIIHVPKRPYDVFEVPPDTSYRETITVSNKTYIIDSLLYRNYSEYAGTYAFEGIYMIKKRNMIFFVVDFFNAFQMGTMVQPCYLLLSVRDGMITLDSIYIQTDIEDNTGRVENSVRVYHTGNKIKLKGKNLKLIR